MFGTLAGKALVPVGLAVTGFMVVCCLVLYAVIKDDLHRTEIVHATNIGDTILKSTRYAMLKSDRDTLGTIIHNVGEQSGVDHVRIFNKKGVVNFSAKAAELNRQVDKSAEGCIVCHKGAVPLTSLGTMQQARTFKNPDGKDVMAIMVPIYNEPDCASAACHVHPPEQKVLGTLDVGLSREAVNRSLWLLRVQMAVFTLLCLILTIGGVTALLRRNVFLPLKTLRTYVAELSAGHGEPAPPPHLPHDLDQIAANCYDSRMKGLNLTEAKAKTGREDT